MTPAFHLYSLAMAALSPFTPMILKGRVNKGKEDAGRLSERQGFASKPRPSGKLIWLHGASIGESQVLVLLFNALKSQYPDLSAVITTQTTTSADLILRKNLDGLIHQVAPLDTPFASERFLSHWKPDLAIFAEGDIWPILLSKLDHKGIPRLLINARMTAKSFEGWMRFPKLAEKLFSGFASIHAANLKTADYLKRFAKPKVRLAGNIKYAAAPLQADTKALETCLNIVGDRPVFAAISTHPGEEDIVLEAFTALEQKLTTAPILILVPRHPERRDEIRNRLKPDGIYIRSSGDQLTLDHSIWLCDTLGEVGLWIRLAKIVYLGGGLPGAGIYGHNPIEPLKLETHVLSLPETDNFKQEFRDLAEAGVANIVTNADELAQKALPFMTGERHFAPISETKLTPYINGGDALELAVKEIAKYLRATDEK